MSEQKNIDTLFKQAFESFEAVPPELVWNNIQKQLEQKPKEKVIPFWWKFSGMVAVLLIGFGFYFVSLNFYSTEKNSFEKPSKTKPLYKDSSVSIKLKEKIVAPQNKESFSVVKMPQKTAFASLEKKPKKKLASPFLQTSLSLNEDKEQINFNTKNTHIKENFSGEGHPSSSSENNTLTIHTKKIDSTEKTVAFTMMGELLKEKRLNKEQKLNRWQVTSSIAPIYFSSMTNGSPLDPKLESNPKTYNTSFSYGVGINYSVNKKIKIRSGLNRVDFDYNTNEVAFYQSLNASKIANLNPTLQGGTIQLEPLKNVTSTMNRISEGKQEGTINQKIGYIEMPLEVSLEILSNRFGIRAIGGISGYYLNQNEVYMNAPLLNMKIGEANNLNAFHFSSNVGLGFNYSILKHFDLKIEPVLKYQINTFTNDAGNFRPYFFGVYSGISYQF